MGKVCQMIYEERNFGGRHYDCMNDCADLHTMFDCCHSIWLESGMFMIYDRPDYTGNQYFMRRGEYTDYMGMSVLNDCGRSCCMIPMHSGSFRMRLNEHFDMGGEVIELTDNCPNLVDCFHISNFNSCNMMDGHWLIYEQPNYRGRHYYLKPGQYESFSDWRASSSRVGSITQLMDL